jgi:hypothetical protein
VGLQEWIRQWRGGMTVNQDAPVAKIKNGLIDTADGNNQLFRWNELKQKTRHAMGGFFHAVGFG